MEVTYKECFNFINGIEKLNSRGDFDFRCCVASLVMEVERIITTFKMAKKPGKGYKAYQEELQLLRENCTIEKEGAKKLDLEAFIPLFNDLKSRSTKVLEESEKLIDESNKALDNKVTLYSLPIKMEVLKQIDQEEKFPGTFLLGIILPFTDAKQSA